MLPTIIKDAGNILDFFRNFRSDNWATFAIKIKPENTGEAAQCFVVSLFILHE